jgi:predicted aspartyl protease
MDDMGVFRTTMFIENSERPGPTSELRDTLVDTGSEFTWVPRAVLDSLGIAPRRKQRFIVADGRAIERDLGFAIVHAGGTNAPDLVVFAEPGDMVLLGAHSLEGLNLMIDPVHKALVSAGPIITGAAA